MKIEIQERLSKVYFSSSTFERTSTNNKKLVKIRKYIFILSIRTNRRKAFSSRILQQIRDLQNKNEWPANRLTS